MEIRLKGRVQVPLKFGTTFDLLIIDLTERKYFALCQVTHELVLTASLLELGVSKTRGYFDVLWLRGVYNWFKSKSI